MSYRHCEELLRRSNPIFACCIRGAMDCFAYARNDVAKLLKIESMKCGARARHTQFVVPASEPGPITTEFSCFAKAVEQRLSTQPPRRMGPGLRRDDVGDCAFARPLA